MKRCFIILICLVVLICGISVSTSAETINENKVKAVYFYSPTCGSCQELKNFFLELKSKHRNFTLIEYSIGDLRNKSLLDKYNKVYKVFKTDEGTVPIVFIRDRYFVNESDIKQFMEMMILDKSGADTVELAADGEGHVSDMERFFSYKTLAILAAGLVNGVNPCSMSMLLMFMSLLLFKKSTILKIGLSFSLGRFIGYLLLGTVLFGFLDRFYINGFNTIIKVLILIIISLLIILNISDYFAAVNEQYKNIRLQLPLSFRKLNHKLIRKVSSITDVRLLLIVSLALGMFISLGEFLCTGQIYLTTIVTVFQTNTILEAKALYFLLIYNLGFILPTLVLTFVIYKGKEVFDLSEAIREKLNIIKLINVIILFIFGIITMSLF